LKQQCDSTQTHYYPVPLHSDTLLSSFTPLRHIIIQCHSIQTHYYPVSLHSDTLLSSVTPLRHITIQCHSTQTHYYPVSLHSDTLLSSLCSYSCLCHVISNNELFISENGKHRFWIVILLILDYKFVNVNISYIICIYISTEI
jgi:hypothetical protein